MDNWNNEPAQENGLEPAEQPVSSGKRNYERYMAGETWSPEQPQTGSEERGDWEKEPESGIPDEWNSGYESGYDRQPVQPVDYHGLEEPVSVGEWMIAMLLMMVPCVNLIFMFIFAFGNSEKKSKSNYFKATLIYMGILIGIYVVVGILAVTLGIAMSF